MSDAGIISVNRRAAELTAALRRDAAIFNIGVSRGPRGETLMDAGAKQRGGIDAGLVGTLILFHVSITLAAGAVLVYRTIALWVPALVGAVAFVALRRTLREEADQVACCDRETEMDIIGFGRTVVHGEL